MVYDKPHIGRLYFWLCDHACWQQTRVPTDGGFITLEPGQLIVGRKMLSTALKLSEQEIRTAISNLQKRRLLTSTPTNKYSIITLLNQEVAIFINQQINQQNFENQPADQPHIKEEEVKKKKKKKEKALPVRFAPPTLNDVKAYREENQLEVDPAYFFKFFTSSDWVDTEGKEVFNWKQKMLTWHKGALKRGDKYSPPTENKPVYKNETEIPLPESQEAAQANLDFFATIYGAK